MRSIGIQKFETGDFNQQATPDSIHRNVHPSTHKELNLEKQKIADK